MKREIVQRRIKLLTRLIEIDRELLKRRMAFNKLLKEEMKVDMYELEKTKKLLKS